MIKLINILQEIQIKQNFNNLEQLKKFLEKNNKEFVEAISKYHYSDWDDVIEGWNKGIYKIYNDDKNSFVLLYQNDKTGDDALIIHYKPFEWNGPAHKIIFKGFEIYYKT